MPLVGGWRDEVVSMEAYRLSDLGPFRRESLLAGYCGLAGLSRELLRRVEGGCATLVCS
jgi:hypothetical protein